MSAVCLENCNLSIMLKKKGITELTREHYCANIFYNFQFGLNQENDLQRLTINNRT